MEQKTIEIAAGLRVYRGGLSHPFQGGAVLTLPAGHAELLMARGHAIVPGTAAALAKARDEEAAAAARAAALEKPAVA